MKLWCTCQSYINAMICTWFTTGVYRIPEVEQDRKNISQIPIENGNIFFYKGMYFIAKVKYSQTQMHLEFMFQSDMKNIGDMKQLYGILIEWFQFLSFYFIR